MSDPVFRPGEPRDIDHVAGLLHLHMNPKVPPAVFRRLLAYEWAGEKPHCGMVAESNGEIVGFHGNVYSMRRIDGVERTFGSFTSLYVHRDWRGHNLGQKMMRTYEERADITYTVFDPSKRVHGILEESGFRDLDVERVVWMPDGRRADPEVEVLRDPALIRPRVTPEEQRYLDDHADLPAWPILLAEGKRQVLVFALKQDRGDQGLCHDLVYCGDPQVFAGLVDAAAPAILGDDPRARLLVDARFLDGHPVRGRHEALRYRRMVRRADPALPDWRVDHLYTETMLLNLKLG